MKRVWYNLGGEGVSLSLSTIVILSVSFCVLIYDRSVSTLKHIDCHLPASPRFFNGGKKPTAWRTSGAFCQIRCLLQKNRRNWARKFNLKLTHHLRVVDFWGCLLWADNSTASKIQCLWQVGMCRWPLRDIFSGLNFSLQDCNWF